MQGVGTILGTPRPRSTRELFEEVDAKTSELEAKNLHGLQLKTWRLQSPERGTQLTKHAHQLNWPESEREVGGS